MRSMKNIFRTHTAALCLAGVVGFLCIVPHLYFFFSMGKSYQGISLSATANEIDYIARVQEIRDGHIGLGSFALFEYKNSPFIIPPSVYDFLMAGIGALFNISSAHAVVVGKAILPPLLFLLIYAFVRSLTHNSKLIALTASSFVLLGYDLIDYRTVFHYLMGTSSPPGAFLLWTRPMNPILGGILLFALLLVLWRLNAARTVPEENMKGALSAFGEKKDLVWVCGGGALLALMIMSYFFSWTLACAVSGMLLLINIFRKRWDFVRRITTLYFLGIVLAIPYWYNAYLTLQSPWYRDTTMRVGAFLTHAPIFNKALFTAFLLFSVLSFFWWRSSRLEEGSMHNNEWFWFCCALLGAGFLVLNQQIITGYTIWPFHYVQYTIPFSIVVVLVAAYHTVRMLVPRLWTGILISLTIIFFGFGTFTQIFAYHHSVTEYRAKQIYGALFSWINQHTDRDCVILAGDDSFLNPALPAYTHCNMYLSPAANQFLIPFDRLMHNYLVWLRMKGVEVKDVGEYARIHKEEAVGYLYAMGGLVRGIDDPFFADLPEHIAAAYKAFLQKPFRETLNQYRIDYVILDNKAPDTLLSTLHLSPSPLFSANGISLYAFN